MHFQDQSTSPTVFSFHPVNTVWALGSSGTLVFKHVGSYMLRKMLIFRHTGGGKGPEEALLQYTTDRLCTECFNEATKGVSTRPGRPTVVNPDTSYQEQHEYGSKETEKGCGGVK